MSRRIAACVAVAALLVPAVVHAIDFPGVSKYSYYSRIASWLRHPMFHDGYLVADGIDWRDSSVFSDSLFADLLPYADSGAGSMSLINAGLGYRLGPCYLWGVGGGAIMHHENEDQDSYGKVILGTGIRQSLTSWLALDVYLQAEYDSSDGFDWEIGGYPIRTPWFSASVHAFFNAHTPRVIESRNRLFFVGFEFLDNLDLDARRYALSVSRRSLAACFEGSESSAFEWEIQTALVDNRLPRQETIFETRMMFFISAVGSGPRGEARPGFHVNLSYTSGNSSGFEGVGAEIGFGAKQIDTAQSQQLYFTAFYNYAAYYYRHPSLMWGLGLTGRY